MYCSPPVGKVSVLLIDSTFIIFRMWFVLIILCIMLLLFLFSLHWPLLCSPYYLTSNCAQIVGGSFWNVLQLVQDSIEMKPYSYQYHIFSEIAVIWGIILINNNCIKLIFSKAIIKKTVSPNWIHPGGSIFLDEFKLNKR